MRVRGLLAVTAVSPLVVLGLLASTAPVATAAPAASAARGSAAGTSLPATFSFAGGGWGHGIGMSQDGAFGMASEGASATKILTHYYTGTEVAAYRDDQEIAVNLDHRVSKVRVRTEALTAGGGGISMTVGTKKVSGRAGDVFTFTVSGTHVAVTKNATSQGTASSVTVKWAGTRHPSSTTLDDSKATVLDLVSGSTAFSSTDHRYRYGDARIVARAQDGVTKLEAVNVLRLGDEYLRGIAEVPSSWPAAALQAQVVAARSYALVKYAGGIKGGCQCHVDSGHGPYYDQVFAGYVKETSAYGSAWRAAVAATVTSSTTGRTVLYKGAPAEAFYSSSTGGRTQNVKDVWGSNVPYLVSVDDHWSTENKYNPNASWGPYNRTQAQVATAFGLADVVRIDLSKRLESGALSSATAWSSAGKKATLPVGTFVVRLGLMSNWVRRADATYADGAASTVAVAVGKTVASSSRTVVIASSAKANTVDALVASPLAHAKHAPLLLSGASGLPSAVTKDLRRRHATSAFLVGGTSALGTGVVSDLKSLGLSVTRISGSSHYATSVAVAKAMGLPKGRPAFVASSTDVASALAAAVPAVRLGRPLLLASSKSGVTVSVSRYLRTLSPTSVTVVGSTSAVSASALAHLPHARRLTASTAAGRAALVARTYSSSLVTTKVLLANPAHLDMASTFPTLGAPILLTGTALDASTRYWLQTHPHIARVSAVLGVVPAATVAAARLA